MRDAKLVQIVNCSGDLMGDASRKILTNDELSLVQESEEVTSIEDLHDDVNRVLILKNVVELDNVRVLAHFKNLDLTLQQL